MFTLSSDDRTTGHTCTAVVVRTDVIGLEASRFSTNVSLTDVAVLIMCGMDSTTICALNTGLNGTESAPIGFVDI